MEKITLNIRPAGHKSLDSDDAKVVVDKTDSVYVIIEKLKFEKNFGECQFIIYKDQVLCSSFSFMYYGVKDNDLLIYVPQILSHNRHLMMKTTASYNSKLKGNKMNVNNLKRNIFFNTSLSSVQDTIRELQLENDSDSYIWIYKLMSESQHADGIAQLKDLRTMKVEGDHKYYRKIVNSFKASMMRTNFYNESQQDQISKNELLQSNEPSTTELPRFWKIRKITD